VNDGPDSFDNAQEQSLDDARHRSLDDAGGKPVANAQARGKGGARESIVEAPPSSPVTSESLENPGAFHSEVVRPAHAAIAVPLVLCSLALFGRALFGGEAMYARDVLHYYWPMRSAAAELIRNLELPQWSPFAQSGLPFLADLHTGVFYPPHALYQFVSFPRAYAWLLFLHHFAAGVGALVFLRRLGAGRAAALSGALAYTLSGYVVGLNNAGSLMAGAAYVPWVLATLSGSLRLSFKIPLLATLVALQGLTGDPQSVLFSLLASIAFMAWNERRKRAALALAGGFGLAGLLAAVQLVPAWYLLGQSNRSVVNSRFFEQFALHPIRLLELIAPFPLGGYLTKPHFWAAFAVNGPGIWPFALSAYLGAAAATAVLIGAGKNRRTGFGISLLLVGVLLALGPHGPLQPILSLPPFRFFRYPEKYLLIASVGMAVLVTQAIERIRVRAIGARRLSAVGIAVGASGLGIAAAHLYRADLEQALGVALRGVPTRLDPAAAVATLLTSARWAVTCGLALWLLSLLTARSLVSARVTISAIACLIGLDLFFSAQSLVFTAPIEMFRTRPAIVDELNSKSPVHPFRYLRDWAQARTFDRDSEESYLSLRAWELETLKSNLGGVFGLEEVAGYAGGFSLGRWEAVALALHNAPSRLGALFNGCLALATMPDNPYARDPFFKRASFDSRSGQMIYENKLCQPRLRTVTQVLPARSLDAALRTVAAPAFEVGSQAVVEGAVERTMAPAQLSASDIQTRRASATVTAPPGGSFVVFGTSYYPGWVARLDGKAAPLKIVNGATMGIDVPEGLHSVEFEFSDPGVKLGFALTLVGVLLTASFVLFGRRLGEDGTKEQST